MPNNNNNIDDEIRDFLESLRNGPTKRKYTAKKLFEFISNNDHENVYKYLTDAKKALSAESFKELTSTTTIENNNALHLAVAKGNFFLVGLIVEHCPSSLLSQANDDGLTPTELAKKNEMEKENKMEKSLSIMDLIESLKDIKRGDEDHDDDLDSTQEIIQL